LCHPTPDDNKNYFDVCSPEQLNPDDGIKIFLKIIGLRLEVAKSLLGQLQRFSKLSCEWALKKVTSKRKPSRQIEKYSQKYKKRY
jgi:hypothetical protein